MKTNSIQVNHPAYADFPEDVLVAFVMLWDLSENQQTFKEQLFTLVEEFIERLPLFEVPSRAQIDAVYDLTDHVEVLQKKGRSITVKVKPPRSVT